MERAAVIVEDQEDIRSLLTAILESSGFTVSSTDNGLDAVELVRTVQPDVTTLDVNIPGIDGFEVARRVRPFSDTYIIFISAFVEPGDAERGRAAGGDEYLGKPFRPRDLKARLAAIPSRRRRDAIDAPTGGDVSHAGVSVSGTALRIADVEIAATSDELAVARQLVGAHGRSRSKDDLALALRSRPRDDAPHADEIRTVERAVESLRGHLDSAGSPTRIDTQQGLGYRLVGAGD